MADSVAGFDRAPDRYMGQERETIDRMRDYCWHIADSFPWCPSDLFGDTLFTVHCELTAMKYRDRAGRKEGEDFAKDAAKADWYMQMAQHVAEPEKVQDPRAGRPGFVPYVRQPWKG